jgi:hypothetical protein
MQRAIEVVAPLSVGHDSSRAKEQVGAAQVEDEDVSWCPEGASTLHHPEQRSAISQYC